MKTIIIILAAVIISNSAYSNTVYCPTSTPALAVACLSFFGIMIWSQLCSNDEITQTQINKAMDSLQKRDLSDDVYYSAMEILHNAKRCQDKQEFLHMYINIKGKRVVWPDDQINGYFDYIKSL